MLGVKVRVAVDDGVEVGVALGVRVKVGVGVKVGVADGVRVNVGVKVGVIDGSCATVGITTGWLLQPIRAGPARAAIPESNAVHGASSSTDHGPARTAARPPARFQMSPVRGEYSPPPDLRQRLGSRAIASN
jgi:hypothetical protein